MPRPLLIALAALAALGLGASIVGRVAAPPAAAIEIVEAEPSANASPAIVIVDVAGAVARPGVVQLPAGSRVIDALAAAGGIGPGADLIPLNRAAVLRDGERIYVPRAGEVVPASAAGKGETRVDLNRASQAELETLPGVGPSTAAKIIRAREQRPFARTDELQTRGLVGARVYGDLRDLVIVR